MLKSRFRKYLPVVVDIETGGFDPNLNAILEIAITLIEEKDKINPALGLLWILPAITQDIKTTKNGFKYSEGWIVNQFKENHRTAPFPKSVPKIGRSESAKTIKKNPTIPNLRTTDMLVVDKKTTIENEIIP